jgi:hypothetical protein
VNTTWPDGSRIVEDLAEATEHFAQLPPRIERVYVRDLVDVEYLEQQCGALLRMLRVVVIPCLPLDHGLLMYSDGYCKTFRLREGAT